MITEIKKLYTRTGVERADGRPYKSDRYGRLTRAGHILADESSRPNENVQVESDASDAQQQVPHENPIHVSQIHGAVVN